MQTRFLSVVTMLILGLSAISGGTVNAQKLKVGYTDHEVLIAAMPDYAKIQGQLQTEFAGAQEALQSLAADFQAEVEKYQKQQSLLSAERRAAREQELAERQQELQEAAGRKDQELAQLEAQLMQPIFDRVQEVIDDVAKKNQLDLVIRHRVGAQPVILYRNEDTVMDITLEVAAALGIKVDEDGNASAASN